MPNLYECGAKSDIGFGRESQEDFVQYEELDGENLFCVIADGTGSRPEHPQPAVIVTTAIIEEIREVFRERRDMFFIDPEYFLRRAMKNANKILGGFKMGSEEMFAGYAASVTCCLLSSGRKIYFAHSGNTRLYILRAATLYQLTKDHTRGEEMLESGEIPDLYTYHVHPARLELTSGLGVLLDPVIDTQNGELQKNDIVLLSTDGVHYAIQDSAIIDIILNSVDSLSAASSLVDTAKDIVKYPDNATAMVLYYVGDRYTTVEQAAMR